MRVKKIANAITDVYCTLKTLSTLGGSNFSRLLKSIQRHRS